MIDKCGLHDDYTPACAACDLRKIAELEQEVIKLNQYLIESSVLIEWYREPAGAAS